MQINYNFKNQELLKLALTHSSLLGAKEKLKSSERLEFLGDSILGMIIAELVYKHFPDSNEGELSIMHAKLVSTNILSEVARSLELGKSLIMDKGEEMNGGRENPNNLENAMEALIAAIYLDSNYQTTFDMVNSLWAKYLDNKENLIQKNIKSKLQEEALAKNKKLPVYEVINKSGPEHSPIFQVTVKVEGIGDAIGEGNSKKAAEVSAATKLIAMMENNNDDK